MPCSCNNCSSDVVVYPAGMRACICRMVDPSVYSVVGLCVFMIRCSSEGLSVDLSDLVDGGFDLYQQPRSYWRWLRDRLFLNYDADA